ncbi:unnamed protein product [Clonostachys byssicola]|uniref:Chromo domain-containing protein n=1 Tax=Clonostachys byssicola TaxID=160290 RepID=A0A9N9UUN9_9HYPO|nr:unnamed protein product [Clonostachys byssicola]
MPVRKSLRNRERKAAAAAAPSTTSSSVPAAKTTKTRKNTAGRGRPGRKPNAAKNAAKKDATKPATTGPVSIGKSLKKWLFEDIVNHKWEGDKILLEVRWQGTDETSWEPEVNIHRDAKRALIQYWKAQGGRPVNPQDEGLFTIYALKGVKTDSEGQRLIQVEWVGFSRPTWEPESAIKAAAPDALEAYLEKKGEK